MRVTSGCSKYGVKHIEQLRKIILINYLIYFVEFIIFHNVGYRKVELIDTTNGKFMKKSEAGWMGLSGSAILTGTK